MKNYRMYFQLNIKKISRLVTALLFSIPLIVAAAIQDSATPEKIKIILKQILISLGKINAEVFLFFYVPLGSYYPIFMGLINPTRTNVRWGYSLAKNIFLYKFFGWNKNKRRAFGFKIGYALDLNNPNLTNQDLIDLYTKSSIINYLIFREGLVWFQEIKSLSQAPFGCRTCVNFQGESYNGNLFICAIHPYGQENCQDYE